MIMLHGLGLDTLLTKTAMTTTTTSTTPAPGTCSADGTKIWDKGGFWRRLMVGETCGTIGTTVIPTRTTSTLLTTTKPPAPAPTSAGCPAGYVMSEFGCIAPTAPSAPCPAGSMQTGYGCIPTSPPPAPVAPSPAPSVTPPAPTTKPIAPTSTTPTLTDRLRACMQPANSTTAECTRLFAEIDAKQAACASTATSAECMALMVMTTSLGYRGAPKNAPGAQITPTNVAPTPTPMVEPTPSATDFPAAAAPAARPPVSKGLVILGVLGAGAAIAAAIFGSRH